MIDFETFLNETMELATQSQAQVPPMVIGFNARGEEIALIGSWRGAKEQLNFATLCRMAFMLHDIESYYFRSEGYMVRSDAVGELGDFISGDKQIEDSHYRQEIMQVLDVSQTGHRGKIYTMTQGAAGRELAEYLDIEQEALTLGDVMLHLLPPAGTVVTNETKEEINELIERLRYKKRKKQTEGFQLLLETWEDAELVIEEPAIETAPMDAPTLMLPAAVEAALAPTSAAPTLYDAEDAEAMEWLMQQGATAQV